MTTEEQEAKQELLKFTEVLKNAGIRAVSVTYSGCGDQGRTEAPQLEGAAGNPIDVSDAGGTLDFDVLGDQLAKFVPEGYENDEGGWGTITFDVESGKIRVEHNWYETVSHAEDPREI